MVASVAKASGDDAHVRDCWTVFCAKAGRTYELAAAEWAAATPDPGARALGELLRVAWEDSPCAFDDGLIGPSSPLVRSAAIACASGRAEDVACLVTALHAHTMMVVPGKVCGRAAWHERREGEVHIWRLCRRPEGMLESEIAVRIQEAAEAPGLDDTTAAALEATSARLRANQRFRHQVWRSCQDAFLDEAALDRSINAWKERMHEPAPALESPLSAVIVCRAYRFVPQLRFMRSMLKDEAGLWLSSKDAAAALLRAGWSTGTIGHTVVYLGWRPRRQLHAQAGGG